MRLKLNVLTGLSLLLIVLVLSSCTATRRMLDNWEDRRETLSRGLADFVDATDRAFGESRVRDAEEIVQVRVDLNPIYYNESEFDISVPVRVRIPLPALERRALFFFQIDSSADPRSSLPEAREQLEENRTVTSGFLFAPGERFRTGAKVDLYWRDDSPQLGLRPFLRWELRRDPLRYYFQKQLFFRTDDKLGAKISFQTDRLFCEQSYLRFGHSTEYQEVKFGLDFWTALIYRRTINQTMAISAELGTSFNPHRGPTRRDDVIGDHYIGDLDDDKFYARFQFVTKSRSRTWLEYAFEPGIDYYFHHQKRWGYGVLLSVRIILFEAFLRDDQSLISDKH
jgi:hypothetical protein